MVTVGLALVFYALLSWQLAAVMLVQSLLMLWILSLLPQVFWPSVIIFVLAWIGQFIGHHVEGKKPSFFKDLQFLLIGPAWLLGFVFRKSGWRYCCLGPFASNGSQSCNSKANSWAVMGRTAC